MCRLYGFRANEPTKVECTLVHAQNALLIQSRSDLRGVSHADGWGIVFYEDFEPHAERRAGAAFADLHFSTTAERVHARTVVAHVRRATVGVPKLENTHPFAYRHWSFAHNGTLQQFDQVRPHLEAELLPELAGLPRGDTDSQWIFHWLLSRMQREGIALAEACGRPQPLMRLLAGAVVQLDRWAEEAGAEKVSRLNLMLTDGHVLVASRWNQTLHLVQRDGVHDCEVCGIPHIDHTSGVAYRAVVVASEPISHETWEEVSEKNVLYVDEQIHAEVQPI